MRVMWNDTDESLHDLGEEGRTSSEESFLSNCQVIKGLLIEQNCNSMHRLKLTNHNFNEAYAYLKSILRHTVTKNEYLHSRVQQLQQAILAIDPQHPLLITNHTKHTDSYPLQQNQLQIMKNMPFPVHKAWDSAQRVVQAADRKAKEGKESMRREGSRIRCFVWQQLQRSIVFDGLRGSAIPKEILVRLYERWNKLNGHNTTIKAHTIKSLLTAELKRMLPALEHSEQLYIGVSFRKDLMPGMCGKQQVENIGLDEQNGQQVADGDGLEFDL